MDDAGRQYQVQCTAQLYLPVSLHGPVEQRRHTRTIVLGTVVLENCILLPVVECVYHHQLHVQ
jgi:hypothetical protein